MPHPTQLAARSDPPASHLILIVEDEPEIVDILASYLKRHGFRTVHAGDGEAALALHLAVKPDLVLLDVQLPRVDGWRVLADIRSRGATPVIMLTAMDQDIDKLTGLRIGADDYVVKPFNPPEVVARVQAVLRRGGPVQQEPRVLRAAPFEIDLDNHEVTLTTDTQRQRVDLTLTEFKLLAQMARAPRRVFSRAELLEHCLPEGDSLERTVDSHVSKLRKKLKEAGVDGIPANVRGVGYRLKE